MPHPLLVRLLRLFEEPRFLLPYVLVKTIIVIVIMLVSGGYEQGVTVLYEEF